jgi:TM2 domain-containing membrane protein YozV
VEKREMNNAFKGGLLSGLVFPGLGQLVLRQYRRGVLIMLVVLISLSVIVADIMQQALDILEQIELQGDAIDINAISNAAAQESARSGGVTINILMLVVVVCWVAGTVDAYRIGRKKDLEPGAPR